MIDGRDSSASRPTAAQARDAYVRGVRVWGGYLATRASVGLYSVWDRASFEVVQQAGMRAVGFCSGWDDAAAVAALGQSWDVLPCLDDEDGIRPRGRWEQSWLDVANGVTATGLYALATPLDLPASNHHAGLAAPFHIAAWYPNAPTPATWPPGVPRPLAPCGWQYLGTFDDHGVSVDALWLDDVLGPAPTRPPAGGNDMAAAHRPDDSGTDLFVVGADGGVDHWFWATRTSQPVMQTNLGGNLLPNTLSAWWQDWSDPAARALVVIGQAASGRYWKQVYTDAASWSGWLEMDMVGATPPIGVDQGLRAYLRSTPQ